MVHLTGSTKTVIDIQQSHICVTVTAVLPYPYPQRYRTVTISIVLLYPQCYHTCSEFGRVAQGQTVSKGHIFPNLPQLLGHGHTHAAVVDGGGKGHVGVLLH